MKNNLFGCRFVSCLIFLTLIRNWKVPFILFQLGFQQTHVTNAVSIFYLIIGALFILLNLIAAVGLFCLQKWSFTVSYLAIIFTTVFCSISYLPPIHNFFLPQLPHIPMILINLAILIYLLYLDVSNR